MLLIDDLITGKSIYKKLNFLNKSQYWTKDEIESYQNRRLRALINHAYNNVPFYSSLFKDIRIKPDEIQTKEDLIKLPIISKDDLRSNYKGWVATNVRKKSLVLKSSSGSTGEPFQFYSTKHAESFHLAAAIRGWYWMGYSLGDKYVKTSVRPRSSAIKKIQDKINNSLFVSFQSYESDTFRNIIKSIEGFDPKFIRGYPAPLLFLANQLLSQDLFYKGKSLKAINTTGSTLHLQDKRQIEKAFNVKIFDSYSCEGGAIFFQCPDCYNYHPAEEYAISEFIEDAYSTSHADRPLRHITTDLHNFASPFIRYDTQDYIVISNEKMCGCGKNFTTIKAIHGRDTDILVSPSGKYILMENILGYFEDNNDVSAHVKQVQVVQKNVQEFVFNLVVHDSFTANMQNRIYKYWQDFIGHDATVMIKTVDKISLTPTGKRRMIIRNPAIKITMID